MKTYIAEIIPKLERFSQKLDNLTLLTNQHWVVFDDNNVEKVIYIFRSNNQLLISRSGKVEKGTWELIGNNSILVDLVEDSYLFKHGFFDKNVLALKLDGKKEYVFLVNENRYAGGELNSYKKIIEFLSSNYLDNPTQIGSSNSESQETTPSHLPITKIETPDGYVYIEGYPGFMNGKAIYADPDRKIPAKTGKYKIGFMWYVYVKNGRVTRTSVF